MKFHDTVSQVARCSAVLSTHGSAHHLSCLHLQLSLNVHCAPLIRLQHMAIYKLVWVRFLAPLNSFHCQLSQRSQANWSHWQSTHCDTWCNHCRQDNEQQQQQHFNSNSATGNTSVKNWVTQTQNVTVLSQDVVTLKSGSEVTQGHWELYHSIDRVWFPISIL